MTTREFRFVGKKTAALVWEITNHGDRYTTRHGQMGGAMQEFGDTPGPKGKEGTKAYVDAVENCKFHCDREIRKKLEHGYVEYVDGKPTQDHTTVINTINWESNLLPKNFCGYKPQTSIDDKALIKLHKAGLARYSRKYDGMGTILARHKTGWELYTRRMDLTTERFPLHVEALDKTHFGPGTIIMSEAVCFDRNQPDREDFKAISSFYRSLPEKSRKIIAEGQIVEPSLIIFDVLFYNGKDLKDVSYDERSKLWKDHFKPAASRSGLVLHVDYYGVAPETWQDFAKEHGWEGFVVTDGSSTPGNKFYSFDGDAKRPKGHHKLKPIHTEDVVIFAATAGSGKRLGGIGAVHVKQLHPEQGSSETKKWMYCGKVGSGFTEANLAEIEKLFDSKDLPIFKNDKMAEKMDLFKGDGLVCEIEFSDRQPGTQKFRFPVFTRLRNDKGVDECIAQKLAPEQTEDGE